MPKTCTVRMELKTRKPLKMKIKKSIKLIIVAVIKWLPILRTILKLRSPQILPLSALKLLNTITN